MAASTSSSSPRNVWLITGCSSGLGKEIAHAALKHGDHVVATARNPDRLDDLKALGSDDKAHNIYGRIDILVNNAGYALYGGVEESSAKEVLALFQTNVFGVLTITRAVLPYMRARRTGTIINIGSASSFLIFPTSGVYSATKAAVSALTRTLRQEVVPLGIKVTVVDLGSLRTNVVNSRVKVEHKIDDFQPTLGPVSAMLDKLVAESKGDPAKAAQLLVEATTQTGRCLGRELPTCLPLGDFEAYRQAHLEADAKELDAWKDFTRPEQVNFDEAE